MPVKVVALTRETQLVRNRYFVASSHLQDGAMNQNIQRHSNACDTLTKTVRDVRESIRLLNRIEDTKAKRLLMEVSKAA
jgi:hypothetical protein